MSTYAGDFVTYLFKRTGFQKENFASKQILEKVAAGLKSLNVSKEAMDFIFDITKRILGLRSNEKILPFLKNMFFEVLYLVVEFFRKNGVAAAFLFAFKYFGCSEGSIITVIFMLVYYLSDYISFEFLKSLKAYIKEKIDFYWAKPLQS